MRSIRETLQAWAQRRRLRRFKLPWAELEAEAKRQGCSPADIFFDRTGRPVPGLAPRLEPARGQSDALGDRTEAAAKTRNVPP